MNIEETSLPGVLVITPKIYSDNRGAFWETWNHKAFESAGMPCTWVQDNFSVSKKNVVRGIHYQVIQPQGKLVRAAFGAVLDVAVDLRRTSPCFGHHVAVDPPSFTICDGENAFSTFHARYLEWDVQVTFEHGSTRTDHNPTLRRDGDIEPRVSASRAVVSRSCL